MPPTARRHHPLLRGLLGLTAVLALVLAGVAIPSPTRAATHAVSVGDGFFAAADLTVAVGDTVTWTNDDDSPHTVTAGGGAFDSGNLEPGQQFSFTFTTPGTYAYVCAYHEEMTGTITVVEAAAAPPLASATTAAPSSSETAGATREQPDTALAGRNDFNTSPWLGPVLIGLGLLGLAFGLLPAVPDAHGAVPAAVIGDVARTRGRGGWRR